MVPAFVAPSVMGPPSSPAETTTRSEEHTSELKSLTKPVWRPLVAEKHPTITVYVPLVGAFTATFPAPCPVALFLRSTPVGYTIWIQGAKSADAYTLSLHDALPISPCVAVNVQVSRSPR